MMKCMMNGNFIFRLICALITMQFALLPAAEKDDVPDYLREGRKKGLWKEVREAAPTPQIKNEKEVFRVDPEKFGIRSGFPVKREEEINGEKIRCYSDAAYHQALANIKGINAAIAAGVKSGAKWIVFPKTEIAICYSSRWGESIWINYDNVIVDFGGSTLKVIYDSEKRSPFHLTYDKKKKEDFPSTNPVYTLNGKAITVVDCNNTTVRNAKLIGDKIDRSFKIQAEKAMESTYGVASGGNCTNVVVEKIDVAFFMGDGLTCSSSNTSKSVRVGYQMGWKEGNLSEKGQEIPGSGFFRSDFLKVNPNSSFYMQGYGYTQGMTGLVKRGYHVYFYDREKQFIGYGGFVLALRYFSSSADTAFVRLVVEEKKKDRHSWQMVLKEGKYGEHITLRDNYIHHNHRGGMTIGVNDMYITRNYFYNNGVAPDKENNLPGFEQKGGNPFMTRYHINMEDSQGHNIHVVGNKFEGGRLGVAVRGNDFTVENNEFIRTGVSFYRLPHVICRNNTFRDGGISSFPYNTDGWYSRNWYIENNTIHGSVSFPGNAPIACFRNNVLKGKFSTSGEISIFKNNTLLLDVDAGFGTVAVLQNIKKIDSCKITKSPDCTVKNTIVLNCKNVENSTFERLKIRVKDSVLRNSTLENCSLDLTGSLQLENCTLIRSDYQVRNNYAAHPHNSAFFLLPKKDGNLVLDRCRIKILDTKVPFFSSTGHAPTGSVLTLKDTKLEGVDSLNTSIFRQVVK